MSKPRHVFRRKMQEIELALFTGAPATQAEVKGVVDGLAAEVGGEAPERVQALAKIAEGGGDRAAYLERWGAVGVRRFASSAGATIYMMAIETFPDHVNNVYFIDDGARATLYDCGSQMESSKQELRRAGFVIQKIWDAPRTIDDVHDLVLSHAHIDHFGGVGAWPGRAKIHVHEFDARVVTRFEERIVTVAMQLRVFLERAGVDEATRHEMENMYVFTKQLFSSVPVDRLLTDGDEVNGFRVHHAPGHCPGQVCLQVHDVLLTTDHILPRITPHQSPESITPWTGLDHYLIALEKFRALDGIRLALPGHEEPIADLRARIDEIEAFHRGRLDKVRELCKQPRTVAELSQELFGQQSGYGRLLALEEAAAHAEYLARRGWLEVANLEEITRAPNPVLRYRAAAS